MKRGRRSDYSSFSVHLSDSRINTDYILIPYTYIHTRIHTIHMQGVPKSLDVILQANNFAYSS